MARVLERIMTLIARLNGGDAAAAAAARSELDAWRSASAANEVAYHKAMERWNAIGSAADGLRGALARPPRAKARMKRVAKAAGVAVMALVALGSLHWYLAQPVGHQAFVTRPAQLTAAVLPDGSRIELAADTRLEAVMYRDRRTVRFHGGEARFEVDADAARPFLVVTRAGEARVIGTAFTVRDRGFEVAVEVERGRVAFGGAELGPGMRLAMVEGRAGPVEGTGNPAPWRSGWLVFDDVPLSVALVEINAWRREPLVLADPVAGNARLTGSFRVDDPEGALRLIAPAARVNVRRGPLGLEVRAR